MFNRNFLVNKCTAAVAKMATVPTKSGQRNNFIWHVFSIQFKKKIKKTHKVKREKKNGFVNEKKIVYEKCGVFHFVLNLELCFYFFVVYAFITYYLR